MADKGLLDPPMFQQSPKGEVDRVKQHVAGARLHHLQPGKSVWRVLKML
jgi:hypothetical protein